MRNLIIFFIANLIAINANCQNTGNAKLDSLESMLTNAKEDTMKVKLLLEISNNTMCADTFRSINTAKNAVVLAEKLNCQKEKIKAYTTLADIYDRCNKNYAKAIYYCLQGVTTAKSLGDNISRANLYNYIGQLYEKTSKHDSALEYFRKSLELNKGTRFQTTLLGNSGEVYNNIGDYQHALDCYEQALKLTEESLASTNKKKSDSLTWVGLLLAIGDVYVSMSQYDKALDNYNIALEITQPLKIKYMEMWALTEVGKVYKYKGDYKQAIVFYEKSLAASDILREHEFKAKTLDELGNVYLETGDITKALNYADQSLAILEESNDLQQLPQTYTTLGKINTRTQHYKEAVNYLQKALDICKKTGALDDEKEAWSALSNAYEQMRQTGKAFDAYRHFIALRDSVYNIDKAKEMVRIDLQAGFNRKQITDSLRQKEAQKEFRLRLQKQRAYTYGGFAGLALVLALSFFIYRNYSQQKKANKIISRANATIQKEKQVSETLLLNILPENVAQELKQAGKVNAKLYDQVTVLFTDFVNFTEAGERFSPQQLVAELDECFQAFDQITGKYNIEKIKTVGDAYLAVSGLPRANPDHASDIVSAAIEIRDFMACRKEKLGDLTFGIRIGINSGSVVAGIVGLKKFAYDIWGDTVNTASRMEQNSEPGKINISEATYLLLKGAFNCQYRGKIQAKNKGMVDMYFVS